jgi:hypothetical protein
VTETKNTLGEERQRLGDGMRDPIDVLLRVQTRVRRDDGEEDVVGTAELGYRHGFPLQVTHRSDLVRAEQLEAANVDSTQQDNRNALVDLQNERRDEGHADIDFAGGDGLVDFRCGYFEVLDIIEPLALAGALRRCTGARHRYPEPGSGGSSSSRAAPP